MGVDGWLRMLHAAGFVAGDVRPPHFCDPEGGDARVNPGPARFGDRPPRVFEGSFTTSDARLCFGYGQLQAVDASSNRRSAARAGASAASWMLEVCPTVMLSTSDSSGVMRPIPSIGTVKRRSSVMLTS